MPLEVGPAHHDITIHFINTPDETRHITAGRRKEAMRRVAVWQEESWCAGAARAPPLGSVGARRQARQESAANSWCS